MPDIAIEIRPPDPGLAGEWSALCRRARANVFMHPAVLHAAHETDFAQVQTLQAWLRSTPSDRLVGFWALRQVHITPIGPAFLAGPPYNYAFLSDPVIEPELLDEVVAAFFDAIERQRSLPNVIRLRYLDGSSEYHPAILKALAARGGQMLKMSERERPYASRELGLKRSGSTRKKLRQDWNRLSALGAADIVNDRSPEAVRDAFETYLTLEAGSWKGKRGTALLCDEEDTMFARRMVSELAQHDAASVAMLRVDGRAIAAQVLLYCGAMAYTWKTAFDSEFAKYSPGAQLVEKMTERLLATDGIEAIESCSPEGGFMNQLWEGRRTTVDLLADVGARKSLGFTAVVAGERGYHRLRGLRDRLRASWTAAPGRRGLAASR